jgi:hypothetical protein
MALVLKDRVKETTTTTGTGSFSLAGAVTGYDSFGQIGSGNTTYYAVYLDGGSEWEVGIGTYTSPSTLSRDTILASSNSGSVVTFSAGQKTIWCDYPAGTSIYASNNGSQTSGQVLKSNGVGTPPTWQTTTNGDVVGPASATDNAVARFDTTTGKLIQNSLVIIGDTGSVTGVNALTAESLTVNNDSTLGFSNADTLDVKARIISDLEPNANNAKDIGTSGRNWRDGFFGRNLDTVNLSVTGTLSFDAAQGTSGQVLTSAGTGNTPTWTTPTTGTVTSVAALTLGTTGTDLSSTVANGTTTPVITLQVPTASATNRGALSSTDWSTFNGKLTNPMTTLGDVIYGASSGTATRLAGNTTSNKYFLSQTGTGTVSAVPSWSTLPTVLPVLNRSGSTISVAVGNGVLPVLTYGGSTVNVAIN